MSAIATEGFAGKVVVITGASSGIGYELAKQLSSKGCKVVVAARTLDKLDELATLCGGPNHAIAVRCDATQRVDHQQLLSAALSTYGKVDVWVNNAGVGMTKKVLDLTDDDFDVMMNVNTRSVLIGMQTVIPYFKEQNAGHVINVSSLLARLPFNAPVRAMYSASKAAVNSLTCNARADVHAEGFHAIQVSLFSPGVVATEFGLHAVHGGTDNRTVPYAQTVEEVGSHLVALIASRRADVYSKDGYHRACGEYYSCDDVEVIERRGPMGYSVNKAT